MNWLEMLILLVLVILVIYTSDTSSLVEKSEISEINNPSKYIRFIIADLLNNKINLFSDEIDDLLLQKRRFLISELFAIHKGLKSIFE